MRKLCLLLIILFLAFAGCKNDVQPATVHTEKAINTVKYAKGLQIYNYEGFTVVKVTQPWPDAKGGLLM